MQTFKKTLLAVVCFLLCLSLLSAILIVPYVNSEKINSQDKHLRKDLAGKLDFLIVGASQIMCLNRTLIDEALNCNSYNLSNVAMTLPGRNYLLEKELDRNPIKTVVIELSPDTLSRDEADEEALGDQITLRRLDSLGERIEYLFECVPLDDWLNVYSRDVEGGLFYWIDLLLRQGRGNDDNGKTTSTTENAYGVALTPEEAVTEHNKSTLSTNYLQKNIDQFKQQINLCRERGLEVIVVVTPLSDREIWCNDGWDEFYQWSVEFCKENHSAFYDFNLLKNRYELFNDSESFLDSKHLSGRGEKPFAAAFCDILSKAQNGEDVSEYFFDSYAEMKALSPYAQYLPEGTN